MSQSESGQLSTIILLRIIKKWRKHLTICFFGSIVVGFIISLPIFMKPMYKSSAVLYPANLSPYSKETPTEQMVQLLNSEDVRDSLVKELHLFKHYKIDSINGYPRYEIMKRLSENISVSKNQYEAIEVDVIDEDPKMAQRICQSLIHFMDIKAISLIHTRALEVAEMNRKNMENEKKVLDSLDLAITTLRDSTGITDFETQIEGFSREYYRALASGGVNGNMSTVQKNLTTKGAEYMTLKEVLRHSREAYNNFRRFYESALYDSKKELEFHNVVSPPLVPEKKDSPKRALVMILFTLSTMLIAIVTAVYIEQYRDKLKSQLQ
jgi:LPS O-antigen subunit length determinant protein (WzzB/FepE family)